MKKWLLAFVALIFSLCLSHMAFAAEHSADTMILDWRTEKGLDGAWRALRAGNIL